MKKLYRSLRSWLNKLSPIEYIIIIIIIIIKNTIIKNIIIKKHYY